MTAAVFTAASYAQQIIINPDGTHSTVIDNGGGIKTIVNPNGTHSTIIGSGGIKTLVNPNGTHSTIIDHGSIKTVVNPNGTHSTVIGHGNTMTVLNQSRVQHDRSDYTDDGSDSMERRPWYTMQSKTPRWAMKRIHRAEKRRNKKNK